MTSLPSPTRKSPTLPLKVRLHIAANTAVTDICLRSDGTLNRRLSSLLDFKASPNPNPNPNSTVRTSDVHIDPSRNLWMRLFIPSVPTSHKLPVILFFHGGGFAFLSPSSLPYDAVCRRISLSLPAVVASVNYRLSPEHRFPSQYDDGAAALRFLAAGDGGIDSCFLAGDSAGANLAHHVAARWAAEGGKPRVSGVMSIQPWFGGEERTAAEVEMAGAPLVSVERTDWLWRAFLPEGEDRDHWAANVFGPRGEEAALPEGFPPTVVVVGGYDPLKDRQRRYYEGLRERGVDVKLVEFPEAIHAFYVFPELPESEKVMEVMREFVEGHRSPEVVAPAE